MNRTLAVVRMQLMNRMTYVWIPLIIIAAAFAMSLVIYALIPTDAPKYGGGGQAPLWYFFAVGIQALTLAFPFSQAMSVTRRQFFVGTVLTAALTSAILAIVFVVGGFIEGATNGWGLNGWFFRLPWIWEAGPLVAALIYFVAAMLLFSIGFVGATVYKRFGALGLTLSLVGLGIVLVGALFLVTRTESWGAVGAWLGAAGPLGLALVGAVVVAVLGTVEFGILRRATP